MVIEYEEVLAAQEKRDAEDAARPVGALRPATDATIVYTDGMDQQEVVDRLAAIVSERLN
jgi:cytidylate kinase